MKRGDAMNKQDLIAKVASEVGVARSDAGRLIECALETISETLKSGEDVRLVGFGTFSVTRRKASTGRNPRTGQVMNIAESSLPKFRAGKALKETVN
ncbi:HU family DNA-binding protein [Sphingomonas sp. ID0503]|uniref:HU family DNA-binding protein n=1 Tax=Sphingomonas sp. ID0503 TaxID=3399691 RepID=UPI003AFA654B